VCVGDPAPHLLYQCSWLRIAQSEPDQLQVVGGARPWHPPSFSSVEATVWAASKGLGLFVRQWQGLYATWIAPGVLVTAGISRRGFVANVFSLGCGCLQLCQQQRGPA
jgi:hypothetical protein